MTTRPARQALAFAALAVLSNRRSPIIRDDGVPSQAERALQAAAARLAGAIGSTLYRAKTWRGRAISDLTFDACLTAAGEMTSATDRLEAWRRCPIGYFPPGPRARALVSAKSRARQGVAAYQAGHGKLTGAEALAVLYRQGLPAQERLYEFPQIGQPTQPTLAEGRERP